MMNNNLCKQVIENGGTLVPLLIPPGESKGLGLMNPSILVEGEKILVNIRKVNYTLYHSENEQLFANRWGPLAYLNPENDIKLKTINFFCTLDENLNTKDIYQVDTSSLDSPNPLWDFHGLEDARIVRWNKKLYMSGVRRDTTPNGEGRTELSEIKLIDGKVVELSRTRIQPPAPSYCEKNWMPILDMPFHYVKWTNPTEVVKVDLKNKTSADVFVQPWSALNLPDFRGGSQVIPWGKYRVCIVHQVHLFNNAQGQKDAVYEHRFIVWDQDWELLRISEPFSFMTGQVEFCCGLAIYKNDFLVTFGFQDNAAFVLRIPEKMIPDLIGLPETGFDWGPMCYTNLKYVGKEIFEDKVYEKKVQVKEGDVVLDIGANVGAFTYSILNKKPAQVYCVEPSATLLPVLQKNTSGMQVPVTYINAAISDKDEETEISFNLDSDNVYYQKGGTYQSITFKKLITDNNISKIDFLKIDCEGGEYKLFTEENRTWIEENVKHISGEFHVTSRIIDKFADLSGQFINFRNLYLTDAADFKAYTDWGEDVTERIMNDDFVKNYWTIFKGWSQIILYMTYGTKVIKPKPEPVIEEKDKIVMFFPFFAPLEKEMLEFKINMYKDFVDEFVICEANKTHTGLTTKRGLRKAIKELGLPIDKITIIDLNIPKAEDLLVEHIDKLNCYENNDNIEAIRARCRDRLMKDSLLWILDGYTDNTVFIHSDCDEFIIPSYINNLATIVRNMPDAIIKIPMLHMEGRADLVVTNAESGLPDIHSGMFVCTKAHLQIATPTQIRSEIFKLVTTNWLTEDGVKIRDLGWHFSWMGNAEARSIKRKSWAHANDTLSFLEFGSYDSAEMKEFLATNDFKDGSIPPLGDKEMVLRPYPVTSLPAIIFELPRVKAYLLPDVNV
jgi:FkbM family methyltransferase